MHCVHKEPPKITIMKTFQRHVAKGAQLGDSAKTKLEQSDEYIVYNEAAHSDRPLGGFHGHGCNERGDYNSSIITITPIIHRCLA